jgi:hypothetical protein
MPRMDCPRFLWDQQKRRSFSYCSPTLNVPLNGTRSSRRRVRRSGMSRQVKICVAAHGLQQGGFVTLPTMVQRSQ